MFEIIVAVDLNNGIGNKGFLPWKIPEEIKIFKEKTLDSIVIVGRKTFEKLPKLKNRIIYCVSNTIKDNHDFHLFKNVKDAIDEAKKMSQISNKKIFVIGGNQIYEYFFKNYKKELRLHISLIKNSFSCDTFFDMNNLKDFYITCQYDYELFTHYEMKYQKYGERQYMDLVKTILENGERRNTRNSETLSDFCKHLKFDLRDGFPLLTTKKMFLKGIIEELLFFIRGNTNTKILEEKGINIWKGNTSREFLDKNNLTDRKEGEMGPMYGSIWRNFNAISDEENNIINTEKIESIDFNIDQLKFVINEIKNNPTSRRILMTSFNPSQVQYGVLWPCHSITIQFYVQDSYLDMFCYNRSSDVGLGLPFNIASSSLFLIIIAKLTNLEPRYFNLTLGDAHIYSNHLDPLKEQIKRMPYSSPKLIIPEFKNLEDVEKLTFEDFKLMDYKSYSTIKMSMIA